MNGDKIMAAITEDFHNKIDANNAAIDRKQRDICDLLEDIEKIKAENSALDAYLKKQETPDITIQQPANAGAGDERVVGY